LSEGLPHPPLVRAFRAPVPPGRPTLRLFEEDGHIRPMPEIENDLIGLALRLYGGSLVETAQRLGIGRTTLYRRLLKKRPRKR